VLVKYFFEKFLEGKAFDVLNLDSLEFLGYLKPFLRYRGKLKIIYTYELKHDVGKQVLLGTLGPFNTTWDKLSNETKNSGINSILFLWFRLK
jgi:hypothetical protein